MREYLFRGKRTDKGEWVYGDLLQNCNCIKIREQEKDIKHIAKSFAVDPESVGQFTGLCDKNDKNGKKIFEGDIVKRDFTLWHGETKKTRETQIGVVVYSNRECGFQVEKKCNLRKPWDGDTIEIIGNIHDNPELINRRSSDE
jgi:uncharacterized phage protein (TIGR01671 family)